MYSEVKSVWNQKGSYQYIIVYTKPKSREACVWEKILSRDLAPSYIANFIRYSELPGKFSFTFKAFYISASNLSASVSKLFRFCCIFITVSGTA